MISNKTTFQKIYFISALALLSACKPVSEQEVENAGSNATPTCIASQSLCEITINKSKYNLKFSQVNLMDKVKTELPFAIELSPAATDSSDSITKVTGTLEGKDMFMGKIPVFFEKNSQSNQYLAQSLLASCSEDEMVWRLALSVEINGENETAVVDFTSQRL